MAKNPKTPDSRNRRYGEPVDFRLRMADSLHSEVQAKAKESGLSMNAWIIDAMEQKVAGALRSTDPAKRLDRLEHDVREIKKRMERLAKDGRH